MFFFFQAEDGIRDVAVTGVQTCALPILRRLGPTALARRPCRPRRDDVGGGREVDRERAGREADARARSGAARARRPARCARRAQHGALRHTSADCERARVRPQRETRFRYPRALRAIGSRAPPLYLRAARDRKSTRLNSSHGYISYAVF